MKKRLTILFICFLQNSFAGMPYYVANHHEFQSYLNTWEQISQPSYTGIIHYIDPAGSDATGDGTISKPWASLAYACAHVSTPGDSIYVNPGTYIETTHADLAVGVNITGAGISSHIKSHYVGDWNFENPTYSSITLSSATDGTSGNQSVGNIFLDGDNLTAKLGILVKGRSNVLIHDITIKNFFINGIALHGSGTDGTSKPSVLASNNELRNITIDNCTDSSSTWNGGANIDIIGQLNLKIHDFNISDTSRTLGHNGDNIMNNRFSKGTKIYNGNSYKPSRSDASWNFHFEIPWGDGGTEIYGVNFYKGDCDVDLGGNGTYDEANYPHLFYIHNCYSEDTPDNDGAHGKYAFAVEGAQVKNVLIDSITFKNVARPFSITDGTSPGVASHDSNIVFRNSTCYNMGLTTANAYMNFVEITKNETGGSLYNVQILNITIRPNPTVYSTFLSVNNANSSTMRKIILGNNIITDGKNGHWATVSNTGSYIDSFTVNHNDLFNQPNSAAVSFTGTPVTNYINSGNIFTDPLLVSSTDYHLQSGSPCIGAAYNYGYGVDIGALQYTVTAPTISMSSDQTISTNSTSISAVGTPYTGHTITSYKWTQTQGTGTIGNSTSASTTVSNLSAGVNKFQCTVTQDDSQTAYATVTIIVNLPVTTNSQFYFSKPMNFFNSNN